MTASFDFIPRLTCYKQKCFIQVPQRRPVLRQFGLRAKQAMTRVSILAFDPFPWRQSRMKLAKTLQMDKPPDELNEQTWMHAHRSAETNLKYPLIILTYNLINHISKHPLCVLPVCLCTSDTEHTLTCFL